MEGLVHDLEILVSLSPADLKKMPLYKVAACNSAPYRVVFVTYRISRASIVGEKTQSVPAGRCVILKTFRDVYYATAWLGARPDATDPAFKYFQTFASNREVWVNGQSWVASPDTVLRPCATSGSQAYCDAAFGKISFDSIGNFLFDAIDFSIIQRGNPTSLRSFAPRLEWVHDLAGLARIRHTERANGQTPRFLIGFRSCEGDNPFVRDIKVCEHFAMPHAADPAIYAGETLLKFGGAPVFDMYDVQFLVNRFGAQYTIGEPYRLHVERGCPRVRPARRRAALGQPCPRG